MHMRKEGFIFKIAICLILACVLVMGAGPAAAEKKPYKIGLVLCMTGPYAFLGGPEKNAALLVQEWINKSGGINGHPLELVIEDSQTDPSKAVTVLKNLLRDEDIIAICGGSASPNNFAMIPIIEKEKIPFMSCGGSIKISSPVKKWVFQVPQTDRVAMAALLKYFNEHGIKKIAMLHSTGGWGVNGKERLQEQAAAAGIEVLGYESFNDKDVDMTAQLTRLRALKPDAILTWTSSPAGAIICKNMKQLGIKSVHAHDHGFGNKKYLTMAGKAANGDVLPMGKLIVAEQIDPKDPQKEVLMKLKSEYEKKTGEPVAAFCAHTHDGILILAEAIKNVGPDRNKIRDYIEKMHFVGANGVFNFSPKDHNGLDATAMVMITVQDGDWKVIKDKK